MCLPTNRSSQLLPYMTLASHFLTNLRIHCSVRQFSFSEHGKALILAERHYQSDEEDIAVVEELDQDEGSYPTGIQGLKHSWKKCVDRKGDYAEQDLSPYRIARLTVPCP